MWLLWYGIAFLDTYGHWVQTYGIKEHKNQDRDFISVELFGKGVYKIYIKIKYNCGEWIPTIDL